MYFVYILLYIGILTSTKGLKAKKRGRVLNAGQVLKAVKPAHDLIEQVDLSLVQQRDNNKTSSWI